MKIEVSIGEIVDKVSILEIKLEKITDQSKIETINKEYSYLLEIMVKNLNISKDSKEYNDLKNVNKQLWEIEDEIRSKEYRKEFDDSFIQLARNVYLNNDMRANYKFDINKKYNSNLFEVKSYNKY
jgi:hypothetical protein